MQTKYILLVVVLIASVFLLTYCNFPNRQDVQEPTSIPTSTPTQVLSTATKPITPTSRSTPTQTSSLCKNEYQPSEVGDTWVYTGSSTTRTQYTRTDAITKSSDGAFTVESELPTVSYSVDYTCTSDGLVADNPVQQYLGALLATPNDQLNVRLLEAKGISLPAKIKPGDTWQQVAEVDARIRGTSARGWLVYDYTAVGFETITVPMGTFEALRVDAKISIEVTPLRIQAGDFSITTWLVPDIGMVKSEGTSNVPGVDFSGDLELVEYNSLP